MAPPDYPSWLFYPRSEEPPAWTGEMVEIFLKHRKRLDTATVHNQSNAVLDILSRDLRRAGFAVEGRAGAARLPRPVLFGLQGRPAISFRMDGYDGERRIGFEVEAGRSIQGNAVYKDLIEASLVVDVDYLVLAVPRRYVHGAKRTVQDAFEKTQAILDAIYSSGRLQLPLRGIMLVGF